MFRKKLHQRVAGIKHQPACHCATIILFDFSFGRLQTDEGANFAYQQLRFKHHKKLK